MIQSTKDLAAPSTKHPTVGIHVPAEIPGLQTDGPVDEYDAALRDIHKALMTKPVFISLRIRGAEFFRNPFRNYVADPTRELVSVVALIDDILVVWIRAVDGELTASSFSLRPGPWPPLASVLYSGENLPREIQSALDNGRAFAAHGGWFFDAADWTTLGLPSPPALIDTRFMLHAAGVPHELNEFAMSKHGFDSNRVEYVGYTHHRLDPESEVTPAEATQFIGDQVIEVLLTRDAYESTRDCVDAEKMAAFRLNAYPDYHKLESLSGHDPSCFAVILREGQAYCVATHS